jgi:ankyrin repeat protein
MLQVDGENQTALHYACLVGDVAIARMLVEAKIDTSIVEADGSTAAALAKDEGHTEIVELIAGAATAAVP